MTNSINSDSKSLKWEPLYDPDEFNKPYIEHIEIKPKLETLEDYLYEIKFTFLHVYQKLILLLGYPEFEIEIQNLIINHDRGNRQGFPKNTVEVLLKIYELHVKKYGKLTSTKQETWEMNRLK